MSLLLHTTQVVYIKKSILMLSLKYTFLLTVTGIYHEDQQNENNSKWMRHKYKDLHNNSTLFLL